MRLRKFITLSHFLKPVSHCSFFETCFYRSTGIVVGMSSWLVVFCKHWSTGIVAGIRFPPFVADHGCMTSPPHMVTWKLIDDVVP